MAELRGEAVNSTLGHMGDIRGLPSEQDLARIESQARLLAQRLAR